MAEKLNPRADKAAKVAAATTGVGLGGGIVACCVLLAIGSGGEKSPQQDSHASVRPPSHSAPSNHETHKSAPKPKCVTKTGILRIVGVTEQQMESIADGSDIGGKSSPNLLRERANNASLDWIKVYTAPNVRDNEQEATTRFEVNVNNHFEAPWTSFGPKKLLPEGSTITGHEYNLAGAVAQVVMHGSECLAKTSH
jgi:hypothetical protein